MNGAALDEGAVVTSVMGGGPLLPVVDGDVDSLAVRPAYPRMPAGATAGDGGIWIWDGPYYEVREGRLSTSGGGDRVMVRDVAPVPITPRRWYLVRDDLLRSIEIVEPVLRSF